MLDHGVIACLGQDIESIPDRRILKAPPQGRVRALLLHGRAEKVLAQKEKFDQRLKSTGN